MQKCRNIPGFHMTAVPLLSESVICVAVLFRIREKSGSNAMFNAKILYMKLDGTHFIIF